MMPQTAAPAPLEVPATPFPIHLTAKAGEMVQQALIQENLKGHGLRVGVVGGGCSGLQYLLDFAPARALKTSLTSNTGSPCLSTPTAPRTWLAQPSITSTACKPRGSSSKTPMWYALAAADHRFRPKSLFQPKAGVGPSAFLLIRVGWRTLRQYAMAHRACHHCFPAPDSP